MLLKLLNFSYYTTEVSSKVTLYDFRLPLPLYQFFKKHFYLPYYALNQYDWCTLEYHIAQSVCFQQQMARLQKLRLEVDFGHLPQSLHRFVRERSLLHLK